MGTWVDIGRGYLRVFRTLKGEIEAFGEVKEGMLILFVEQIEKKYGPISNLPINDEIREVDAYKFEEKVKPKIREIYDKNAKV